MKLIAFTGLPRSGKDTAADYIVATYGFRRFQYSEPLKQAAAVLLNRPVEQMRGADGFDREAVMTEWGFSVRWFLQVLGTECMRDCVRKDFWVQHMRNTLAGVDRAVITDLRFENEAALVRSLGGIVVQVWRPGVVASAHTSDAGVIADTTIFNGGTVLDLKQSADTLVREYGLT